MAVPLPGREHLFARALRCDWRTSVPKVISTLAPFDATLDAFVV